MNTSFKWTLSTSKLAYYISLGNSLFWKNTSNLLVSKTESLSKTSHCPSHPQTFQSPLWPSLALSLLPQYMKVFLPASTPGSVVRQGELHHLTKYSVPFSPFIAWSYLPTLNANIAALFSIIDQIYLMNIGLSFLINNLIFLMNTPPRKQPET